MRSFSAPETASLLTRSLILSTIAAFQQISHFLIGNNRGGWKQTNRGVGVINDHDLKGRLSNDTVVLRLITAHS